MKKLLTAGSMYLKKMDVTDLALLKICMAAFGVLVGLGSAKRHRKGVGLLASLTFAGTFLPLMGKFIRVLTASED